MNAESILHAGTVLYEAREPKQTSRGPRINVKVTLDNGKEVQVWANPDSPIADWKRGQRVNIKQKGEYFDPAPGTPEAAGMQSAPQAAQKPIADISTPEAVEALQKRAHVLTGLYLDIYAKLIEGDPNKPFASGINKEDLSSAAATIFIQATRG